MNAVLSQPLPLDRGRIAIPDALAMPGYGWLRTSSPQDTPASRLS